MFFVDFHRVGLAVVDQPAVEAPPDDAADLAEPDLAVDVGEQPPDRAGVVGRDADVGVQRPDLRIGPRGAQELADPGLDVAVGVERVGRGDLAAGAVGCSSRCSTRRRACGRRAVGWPAWVASSQGQNSVTHGNSARKRRKSFRNWAWVGARSLPSACWKVISGVIPAFLTAASQAVTAARSRGLATTFQGTTSRAMWTPSSATRGSENVAGS